MLFNNTLARSLARLGKQGLLALATMAGAALFSSQAAAVSAQPGLRSFPLDAAGRTFAAEVIGDEHFDYLKTTDGIVVVWSNASGQYEIAQVGQTATGASALMPTGTPVSSLTTYGGRVDPSSLPAIDDDTLNALWDDAIAQAGGSNGLPLAAGAPITTPISRALLTVLVEFTQGSATGTIGTAGGFDGTFSTDIAYWKDTLHGNLPGSVNHYYKDMSLGKFSFHPAAETHGTVNDGMIRVRLPAPHPNSAKDYPTIQIYLKQALSMANPYINFASYDADGDGDVDSQELNVIFIVAGYESATTGKAPGMWAHAKGFYAPQPTLDGKVLTSYSAFGEIQRSKLDNVTYEVPATVGVIVHELGHAAVGLPDLYKGPTPLGGFCVMASGSWGNREGELRGTTPTAMSAWARLKTGFMTAIEVEPGTPSQVIGLAQTAGTDFLGSFVYPTIYKVKTSNPDRYFLIDNRQNEGYDSGLAAFIDFSSASGGLGVYRVDDGKITVMADNPRAPSDIDALYSKEGGKTFTPTSDPSSDDAHGGFTGVSLTDVSGSGPLMIATLGYVPFDCNAITATLGEHEIHGRAKLVWANSQLGYELTGSQETLGLHKNATVTLHAEAPGMWSSGPCP